MKICLMTSRLCVDTGPEGSEAHRLAEAYRRRGLDVRVLAGQVNCDDPDFTPSYPLCRLPAVLPRAQAMAAFVRLVWGRVAGRFDVLDCHGLDPFGNIAAHLHRLFDAPVALTPRTGELLPERPAAGRMSAWRRRASGVLRNVDAVVARSLPARAELVRRGVPPRRIRLIPKGFGPVTLDERAGFIHPRPYVLALASTGRYDAMAGLVRAFAEAPRGHGGADLLIAGDVGDREGLLRLHSRFEAGGGLEFLGPVDARFRLSLIKGALFAVFPEPSRAAPDNVLPCLALGCPVVLRDAPGVEMYVSDGDTGLVVRDNEAGLREAIGRLLADEATRSAMATSAAAHAERFRWDRIAGRYLALYRRIVGGRR